MMMAAMPCISMRCACDDHWPCHAGQDIDVPNHGDHGINIRCICVSDIFHRAVVAVDRYHGHLDAVALAEVPPSR